MIGKIMSEVSNTIIGMLSANPKDMGNRSSSFDFGSLLASPEEQPHSTGGEATKDVLSAENLGPVLGQMTDVDGSMNPSNAVINLAPITFKQSDLSPPTAAEQPFPSSGDVLNENASSTHDRRMVSVMSNDISQKSEKLEAGKKPISIEIPSQDREVPKTNSAVHMQLKQAIAPDAELTERDVRNVNSTAPKLHDHEDGQLRPMTGSDAEKGKTALIPESVKGLVTDRLEKEIFRPRISKAEISQKPMPQTGDVTVEKDLFQPGEAIRSHANIQDRKDVTVPPLSHRRASDDHTRLDTSVSTRPLNGARPVSEAVELSTDKSIYQAIEPKFGLPPNDNAKIKREFEKPVERRIESELVKNTVRGSEEPDLIKATAEKKETEFRSNNSTSVNRQAPPITANFTTGISGHEATQKPAVFDWNASQFPERLVREITSLSANGDAKTFEINPRNLGRMEIAFLSRGSSEIIQIQTENDAVREAILQHSPAMQELLKAQGRSDFVIRVDVRENAFAQAQHSGSNLQQHENDDAAHEQPKPTHKRDAPSLDEANINTPARDEGRYA